MPGFSFIASVCLCMKEQLNQVQKKALVDFPVELVPTCTLIVNQDKGAVPSRG